MKGLKKGLMGLWFYDSNIDLFIPWKQSEDIEVLRKEGKRVIEDSDIMYEDYIIIEVIESGGL